MASSTPSPQHQHPRAGRVSWAWVTLIVAVLLGIALVDFLAQNTRTVRIEFFSASGNVPIVVALLVAALAGAVIVLLVGGARIGQLRRNLRRGPPPVPASDDPTNDGTTHGTSASRSPT